MMKKLNILITGGAGFIGTHLSRQLLALGHAVTSWDIKTASHPVPGVNYLTRDIRHFKTFEAEILDFDFIFHFAAIVSVPLCQKDPIGSYETNVDAAFKLAECLARHKKPMIFSSSSAVYGALGSEHKQIAETLPLPPPLSFYAVHKRFGEDMLRQFKNTQKAPFLSLRFFNVYGEGQDRQSPYSGVMTIYAEAAAQGQPIKVFGDGQTTRDFVHVEDVVRICAELLQLVISRGADFEESVLNVGTGETITIAELAQLYCQKSRLQTKPVYEAAREGDIPRSCADISRLKKYLSWTPRRLSAEHLV